MAKETLKLIDSTKVRLWVEMHPKVVLPALTEVQERELTFTVSVNVPVNEERKSFRMTELTRCREEPRQQGDGAPVKSRQLGQVRGSMGDKVDNSWRPLSRLRNSNSNGLWARQENRNLGNERKKEDPYLIRPNFNVRPKIIAKPRENFLKAKSKDALVKKACPIKVQEERETSLDLSQAQVKERPLPPFKRPTHMEKRAPIQLLDFSSLLRAVHGSLEEEFLLQGRQRASSLPPRFETTKFVTAERVGNVDFEDFGPRKTCFFLR